MVKEDEKLIIEDGVTVLEPLSFVDCKAKEIIMPDSVETIKHCAFKNCDNLKKIVFGKGIKVIDRDAFPWLPYGERNSFPGGCSSRARGQSVRKC